ncbi:hypothetical protein [Tolypothrix sp. NIES-4075]|nr:hypothetical protein [Tolypothrix sp. NIES-4075]
MLDLETAASSEASPVRDWQQVINARCPLPDARCPMPNAPCPMPRAQ